MKSIQTTAISTITYRFYYSCPYCDIEYEHLRPIDADGESKTCHKCKKEFKIFPIFPNVIKINPKGKMEV